MHQPNRCSIFPILPSFASSLDETIIVRNMTRHNLFSLAKRHFRHRRENRSLRGCSKTEHHPAREETRKGKKLVERRRWRGGKKKRKREEETSSTIFTITFFLGSGGHVRNALARPTRPPSFHSCTFCPIYPLCLGCNARVNRGERNGTRRSRVDNEEG